MKTKETVSNDNINLQADKLDDLPLTDEQAEETKGGSDTGAGVIRSGTGAGVILRKSSNT